MTTDDTHTPQGTGPDGDGDGHVAPAGRRRGVAAVAVGLAAAVVATVVVLTGGDEGTSAASVAGPSTPAEAPGTTAPAPGTAAPATPGAGEAPPGSPAAEPAPAGETRDAAELPPTLPEVPLDAPVTAADGLVVTLPRIEAIEGAGQGPGNVSGPALRVTVRIQNTSAAPVPLDVVTVNAYHGSELTPASPLEDPSRQPFVGDLPEGEAAEGVYVFSVPGDAREDVTVEMLHRADAPRLLFSGPVT